MNNLILDFTHCYPEERRNNLRDFEYLDCSDISGCNMYCTKEAEEELRRRLMPYGPDGVHFLDSGNYHYLTKLFLEKIKSPFSLILFDYHNDMQIPMIHDLDSCGSWAGKVLWENAHLVQMVLIGPDEHTIEEIPWKASGKLICVSLQELEERKAGEALESIERDIPVYISIDKDVLDRHYARTNWSQGGMSVKMLENVLERMIIQSEVIGADICGECPANGIFAEAYEAEKINRRTNQALYRFLRKYLEIDNR